LDFARRSRADMKKRRSAALLFLIKFSRKQAVCQLPGLLKKVKKPFAARTRDGQTPLQRKTALLRAGKENGGAQKSGRAAQSVWRPAVVGDFASSLDCFQAWGVLQ